MAFILSQEIQEASITIDTDDNQFLVLSILYNIGNSEEIRMRKDSVFTKVSGDNIGIYWQNYGEKPSNISIDYNLFTYPVVVSAAELSISIIQMKPQQPQYWRHFLFR